LPLAANGAANCGPGTRSGAAVRGASYAPLSSRTRAGHRPRPLDARAAIQGGLRHQSDPLPHHATARSSAARDLSTLLTCRGSARCRILRPEPHDAHVHARLRGAARTMGRSRRHAAVTGRHPSVTPHKPSASHDARGGTYADARASRTSSILAEDSRLTNVSE